MKKSFLIILLLICTQILICFLLFMYIFSTDESPTFGLGLIELYLIGAIGSVLISIAIFSHYKVDRTDLGFATLLSVLFWLFVVPYAYVKLTELKNEKYQKKIKQDFKQGSLIAPGNLVVAKSKEKNAVLGCARRS